uniref:Uncharacterized protein n=1 Tax=Mandrillus leucophaeus TaxID=9568 RepID=A0A2K5XA79_MANLE
MHFWSCFCDVNYDRYLRSQILALKCFLYSSLIIINILKSFLGTQAEYAKFYMNFSDYLSFQVL